MWLITIGCCRWCRLCCARQWCSNVFKHVILPTHTFLLFLAEKQNVLAYELSTAWAIIRVSICSMIPRSVCFGNSHQCTRRPTSWCSCHSFLHPVYESCIWQHSSIAGIPPQRRIASNTFGPISLAHVRVVSPHTTVVVLACLLSLFGSRLSKRVSRVKILMAVFSLPGQTHGPAPTSKKMLTTKNFCFRKLFSSENGQHVCTQWAVVPAMLEAATDEEH